MANEHPMITRYQGKVVDEMSHPELVEAVKTLGRLYNNSLQERLDDLAFSRKLREARG